MRLPTVLAVASLSSVALAAPAPASPTATDVADVYAAQATALTLSPTSKVKGKAFDRYVSIWFENTDYETAAADRKHSSYPFSQCAEKSALIIPDFSAQLGVEQ
jgi:acid phosphatase